MILRLIMDCDFRVGNDEYMKQNNSYGVSTLKNKHVLVKGDSVTIDINDIGLKSAQLLTINHNNELIILELNKFFFEKVSSPYLNIAHKVRKGENGRCIIKF